MFQFDGVSVKRRIYVVTSACDFPSGLSDSRIVRHLDPPPLCETAITPQTRESRKCFQCRVTDRLVHTRALWAARLGVGSERNGRHEVGCLLSRHHLHRLGDKMKLLNFLCLPKSHRRARSKTRNDQDSLTEGHESGAGLAVPRPTESTPDLRVGTSNLPTPSPLTPHDQESNSM